MLLPRPLICALGLALAFPTFAAGNLDAEFGDGGRRIVLFDGGGNNMDDALALDVTANGTVVLAGTERIDATHDCIAVSRLLPNGNPDASFSFDGKFVQPSLCQTGSLRVNAVKVDTSGRIVFAGSYTPDATGESAFVLGRIKADGSDLDDSFAATGLTQPNLGGSTYSVATALALQSDGKIVTVGTNTVNLIGSLTSFSITRHNSDGTQDTTFNGTGYQFFSWGTTASDPLNDQATAVGIQGDGKIVVAGTSQQTATGADFGVIRLNANGTIDTGFGGSGTGARLVDFGGACKDDIATALAVRFSVFAPEGSGVVIAGTQCRSGNDWDFAVAVLDENGLPDTAFDGDGRRAIGMDIGGLNRDVAKAVSLESIGSFTLGPTHITLGGFALNTQTAGAGYDLALARVALDGALDTGFGNGGRVSYGVNLGSGNNDFGNAMAVRNRRAWLGGSIQRASAGDYDFAVLRVFAGDTIFASRLERH